MATNKRFVLIITILLIFFAGGIFSFSFFSSPSIEEIISLPIVQVKPIVVENRYSKLNLEAKSVYVYDIMSHQILFERDAHTVRPLASLTKVMTAIVAREVLSPKDIITIPYAIKGTNKAGRVLKGDEWRVQDLINYTLISSSNDGAEIVASAANDLLHGEYAESSTSSATLWRMNSLAQSLGLSDMQFNNASGLDITASSSGAYGSAYDMAQLFIYAASTTPDTFAATGKSSMLFTSVSGNNVQVHTTDEALDAIPGLIIGKTGYTDLAGGNLAILFDLGPQHPVVIIVMGSSEKGRFTDMRQILSTIKTQ